MAEHNPGPIRILNGCVARLMLTACSNGKAPLRTYPVLLSYNLTSSFNENNTVGTTIVNEHHGFLLEPQRRAIAFRRQNPRAMQYDRGRSGWSFDMLPHR